MSESERVWEFPRFFFLFQFLLNPITIDYLKNIQIERASQLPFDHKIYKYLQILIIIFGQTKLKI